MTLSKSKMFISAGALIAVAAVVVVATHPFSSRGLSAAELKQADTARVASGTLKQRFVLLSQRHTNQCGLASADLNKISVHGRLQGSCCRPIDFGRYVQQVRGLRAYAVVSEIPADPYDIPVSLAKRLIGYGDSIRLGPAQQSVYNRVVDLSEEHGPCCCHCWRWHAFGGQAKQLIALEHYGAARIARVWNLEDGCGGAA
jgi:hypothetical protein